MVEANASNNTFLFTNYSGGAQESQILAYNESSDSVTYFTTNFSM